MVVQTQDEAPSLASSCALELLEQGSHAPQLLDIINQGLTLVSDTGSVHVCVCAPVCKMWAFVLRHLILFSALHFQDAVFLFLYQGVNRLTQVHSRMLVFI